MNGNIWKVLGALAAAALGVVLAYDRTKKNTITTATPVEAAGTAEQETEQTEEQTPEKVNDETEDTNE